MTLSINASSTIIIERGFTKDNSVPFKLYDKIKTNTKAVYKKYRIKSNQYWITIDEDDGNVNDFKAVSVLGYCSTLQSNPPVTSCDSIKYIPSIQFQGYFNIKSEQDQTKCVDLDSNTGEIVHLFGCNGSNNQKWKIGTSDNDGYYTIISSFNNKCLGVNTEGNGIVDNSDNISGYLCNGDVNQKWKIDGVILRNKANGANYCLDFGDSNNNVHIISCVTTNNNQRLKFISTDTPSIPFDGYFNIKPEGDQTKCVDLDLGSGEIVHFIWL